MANILSPIQLIGEGVTKVDVEVNTSIKEFKHAAAEFGVTREISRVKNPDKGDNENAQYSGSLSVNANLYNDEKMSLKELSVSMTVHGMIHISLSALSEEMLDDLDKVADFNFTSLLYSYARIQIERFIASTPYQQLNLPTISIQGLLDSLSETDETEE
ncbi:MAG: hypothetical protein FWF45_04150 [Coriobacteriia bacterium]|nr:hypothetical protein [Coriobacteriia bacterium]